MVDSSRKQSLLGIVGQMHICIHSDPVSTHKTCRSSRHTKSSQEEWEVGRTQRSIDILSLLVEGNPFSSIKQRNSHTPGQLLGPGVVSQDKVKFIEFFFEREKLGGYRKGKLWKEPGKENEYDQNMLYETLKNK